MSVFLNRKSIRHYDENYKIGNDELKEILNKTLRAPSSMNLQPTRFVVIQSDEGKEKIKPSLYGNNLQLDTSSAFIILFTDLKKYDMASKILNNAVKSNKMPQEVADRQLALMNNMAKDFTTSKVRMDGYLDAGLIAMQLMLVAKDHGYDTCAIGGFNKDNVANILGLDEERYEPVLMISLGKAKEEGFKSYRLDLDDVATFI